MEMAKKSAAQEETETLNKHLIMYDQYLKRAKREFDLRLKETLKTSVTILDFELLRVLGTGSFGKVILCKHRATKKVYAVKMMEKANIIRTKQLVHTISEIRFLDAIKCPFVVNMDFFFKNNVYVFLVMPFINGGEMFYHLRKMKKFDESLSKFYAAQVILAFEYLHHLGLVYRDLKPENILLDREGYLKITDLGFCKKIDDSRTYTLCGTPEYLAPEIILTQGYSYSVDWWSLGILIYEMAAGFPPFNARDHMKLYEKIISGKYAYPPHFSKSIRDLISNMLQLDRSKRYGVMKAGSRDIKSHDWFKGTNFDLIMTRQMKPSFVPSISGEGDVRFFEKLKDFELRDSVHDEYAQEFSNLKLMIQT